MFNLAKFLVPLAFRLIARSNQSKAMDGALRFIEDRDTADLVVNLIRNSSLPTAEQTHLHDIIWDALPFDKNVTVNPCDKVGSLAWDLIPSNWDQSSSNSVRVDSSESVNKTSVNSVNNPS
jgi:hypothetical protein